MSAGRRMIRALLQADNDLVDIPAGAVHPRKPRVPMNLQMTDMVGRGEPVMAPNLGPAQASNPLNPLEVDAMGGLPFDMPLPPSNIGYNAGKGMARYARFSGLPWKGRTPPEAPTLENDLLEMLMGNDKKGLETFSQEHFGKSWEESAEQVLASIEDISEAAP